MVYICMNVASGNGQYQMHEMQGTYCMVSVEISQSWITIWIILVKWIYGATSIQVQLFIGCKSDIDQSNGVLLAYPTTAYVNQINTQFVERFYIKSNK